MKLSGMTMIKSGIPMTCQIASMKKQSRSTALAKAFITAGAGKIVGDLAMKMMVSQMKLRNGMTLIPIASRI